MMNKKGQEEMIGFAVIIIIVAVVILIMLGISLNKSQEIELESYEVPNFMQATLQYTTDCVKIYEPNYLTIQKLIFECKSGTNCLNGRSSCEVLGEDLKNILETSWDIREESLVKGYSFEILVEGEELFLENQGNETKNYKGTKQNFEKNGISYDLNLKVYY